MRLDDVTKNRGDFKGRNKCLMAATVDVIDILAGDVPILDVEYFIAENLVGVSESIEDKSKISVVSQGSYEIYSTDYLTGV